LGIADLERLVLKSAIKRFLKKINVVPSGCWELTSYITPDGYGTFWFNGKTILLHRFIYEYYHGAICPDLEIDHLCRNRKCVNTDHLEAVTHIENCKRGLVGKINNWESKKTHCPQGHEYTPENTYKHNNKGIIHRRCNICNKNHQKIYRMKV